MFTVSSDTANLFHWRARPGKTDAVASGACCDVSIVFEDTEAAFGDALDLATDT